MIWESANAATGPHLRNSSRVGWERNGAELYLGARCGREGLAGTVKGSLSMTPVTKSTPHTTQSHDPMKMRELRYLFWPLTGGYVEALLSDPIERLSTCDTLMKSSAKAKSFHVAVRGNFHAARDFAKPDTYTTSRRRAVGNRSSSESSAESSP